MTRTGSARLGGRGWLVAVSLGAMALGIAAFLRSGLTLHLVGYVFTSLVPPVLLGLHNQRAQLRRRKLGIIMTSAMITLRRLMLVAALILGPLHAYFFAVALELRAVS